MRNPPPQQETYPQRQFPLAQFRYGREEMLAIFEQIGITGLIFAVFQI